MGFPQLYPAPHQYVERRTGKVRTEKLVADRLLNGIYFTLRESPSLVFRSLTSPWMSKLLALAEYDLPLSIAGRGDGGFLTGLGVDWSECLNPPESVKTPRDVFERKIRYWQCRPMDPDPRVVVSPADSRVLLGSLEKASSLFLKEKFFSYDELLGVNREGWKAAFETGDYAVFRLTPDKYHYNHTPVAGRVLDIYEVRGAYHSCNPGTVVASVTPYSKNARVVTILDTDVSEGSHVGLIAMIEIVALMIGDIVQCYSETRYDHPHPVRRGMFLQKGAPKSLYRPGSSTDVLLFQQGRVRFCRDLVENMQRPGVSSRFSLGFGRPLVETDLRVRSAIAVAA